MGVLLVAQGVIGTARRYLAQAEEASVPNLVAHMSALRNRRRIKSGHRRARFLSKGLLRPALLRLVRPDRIRMLRCSPPLCG